MLENIAKNLGDLDSDTLKRSIEDALQKQITPQEIIREGFELDEKNLKKAELIYGRGKCILNVLPWPGVLSTETRPPWH